jgi:ABC-type branched-subunit amino acid transport system substrate-binding protein
MGGIIGLGACDLDSKSRLQYREDRAEQADKEANRKITIGVAWSFNKDGYCFIEGAKFAVDRLNNQGGLLTLHRKIELKERDERVNNTKQREAKRRQQELDKTHEIARTFAKDLDVIAVIGHRNSSQAIQASITYEQQGIVFLAPSATHLSLTNHNFSYVFRMMPDNGEMGTQLANYFQKNNYKRVAILNERSAYADQLSEAFINGASNKVNIVFQRSFFKNKTQFTDILAELKKKIFLLDAIFLVTTGEKACAIITQAREIGIKEPFIGGDAMLSSQLEKCPARAAVEGTVVPTLLDIPRFKKLKQVESTQAELIQFANYLKKTNPNCIENTGEHQRTLLGYDAINLLAHAIDKAKSTIPIKIANQLRYMDPWDGGIIGDYAFQPNGNLKRENANHVAVLCNQRFEVLSVLNSANKCNK